MIGAIGHNWQWMSGVSGGGYVAGLFQWKGTRPEPQPWAVWLQRPDGSLKLLFKTKDEAEARKRSDEVVAKMKWNWNVGEPPETGIAMIAITDHALYGRF